MEVRKQIATTEYSIRELLGNKIKTTNERFAFWLLTENLDKNLITRVGDIIYTNRGKLQ